MCGVEVTRGVCFGRNRVWRWQGLGIWTEEVQSDSAGKSPREGKSVRERAKEPDGKRRSANDEEHTQGGSETGICKIRRRKGRGEGERYGVCVCVCERERERGRSRDQEIERERLSSRSRSRSRSRERERRADGEQTEREERTIKKYKEAGRNGSHPCESAGDTGGAGSQGRGKGSAMRTQEDTHGQEAMDSMKANE
eukprot:4912694-Pleurochrysis_carterae.AAC.1